MAAERKHALLMGVDRYPFLPEKWQLAGCVHDVRALAGLLCGRFGFAPEDVVLLENEAATQAAIRGALDALRGRVGPGEPVVLAWSGHGSRVRAEGGGWVETLVPVDSGRGAHPNRDVRDGEIHDWLLALSAVTSGITLVFDSCFSGGITRDAPAARTRGLPPDLRPAAVFTPSAPSERMRWRDAAARGTAGWLPWSGHHVLLAACRHDESAHEIVLGNGADAVHRGAFSHFLHQELAAAGAAASHRDVFERAALQVTAAFQLQHPRIEGAPERELFGVRATDLDNRDPASRLAGKIELRLFRRGGGGEWVPAVPGALQEKAVLRAGDRLAFEVVNRAEVPVYVSVLDAGLTGRITLLHPVPGAHPEHPALAAGERLRFGVRSGEEMSLFLPPEAPRGGIETVKVFATTEPVDPARLEQEGFQAFSPAGHGTGDWAAAAQSFFVTP